MQKAVLLMIKIKSGMRNGMLSQINEELLELTKEVYLLMMQLTHHYQY